MAPDRMALLGRYLAVALFLLTLLAATLGLRSWHVSRTTERGDEAQRSVAARVVEIADEEVTALERELIRRAERIAALAPVRSALRGESGALDAVVATFATFDLPDGYAAELYTPTPTLVAWHGPSLPLDPATRTTQFLSRPQTSIANDEGVRQALVVWLPILEGGRVLGAVRMLRVLRARVPVRNQYLRDFDLPAAWERRAGVPMEVRFEAYAESDTTSHVVRGQDGTALAVVDVPSPAIDLLEERLAHQYDDVAAFWIALLLGWLGFGLVLVLRAMARRAALKRDRSGWWQAYAVLGAASVVWVGVRYVLIALRIPARWFSDDDVPLGESTGPATLFDPAYLASGIGDGLLGSAGELAVTALFALALGMAWYLFGAFVSRYGMLSDRPGGGWALRAAAALLPAIGILLGHAIVVRRATIDATLPYFDRAGPFSEPLVMFVFGAFQTLGLAVLLALAGLALAVGLRGHRFMVGSMLVGLALASVYVVAPQMLHLPWWVAGATFGAAGWAARIAEREPDGWVWPLSLRGVLVLVLVVTALNYPVVYEAVEATRTARILDVADEFADGEDSRVGFALEGVLLDARASAAIREVFSAWAMQEAPSSNSVSSFDSLATDLVTGSLLVSLADYTIGLDLLAPSGDSLGRYREVLPPGADPDLFGTLVTQRGDPLAFGVLRARYASTTAPGFIVEREPAEDRGAFRYAGLGPIRRNSDGAIVGWVLARAEPKPARYASETPFPRVLVPAGLTSLAERDLSLGEFRDGVLIRSRGNDFGRFRLPEVVIRVLGAGEEAWVRDEIDGRPVRVYYRRLDDAAAHVVAVRESEVVFFDHLYFFLRLLLPGLVLGITVYAVRQFRAPRVGRSRLRDRVLNRFLTVGVASVVLTGLVGQAVIIEQNRQAVQDRLKRRLARMEAALYAEANPDGGPVPLYRLIDRARPDVVGPREGLDVNLYRGADLVGSSRSQLVRQQLIDRRLPIEVYHTLFVEGERYAFAQERIGTFTYTTGYEALPDDDGRPGAVIAIPTLPEQLAIESDQARMVAYLFGILLLLLVGIFFITTLLANRLTRPFRRLRAGLLAVGAGEAPAEPIPVESSDEVGELIETFNAMHSQLEASRRKLALQERELAWREMARQVAHEIKNPLTPMKLSVQHLRRAHEAEPEAEHDGRFAALLDRISGTLIEQIDALTRIANEFSTFARLPERHPEPLDLNAVIREAAALSGEEEHAALVLDLATEPLPILADREELRRVYINLFKNALQAMPERGTITVRTAPRTDGPAEALTDVMAWAWSAVRDTGTGIPPDACDKVFQPNFSTKTSGMGLGLAISKKAVEDLHGTIEFETEMGRGTTFFVWLPLREASGEDDAAVAPR